jgi:DNA-binding transcriptional regulator GbsR (MarR family)
MTVDRPPAGRAEEIRRGFAAAWGDVGSRWGVPPATARVHGYLLTSRFPLTEREVRQALGLSHRAASMALAESEAWGLVERVPGARRAGRRGPAGTAWVAVGDHWRWLGRVVEQRRLREGDPAVAAIQGAAADAVSAVARAPDDQELAALRDRLDAFLAFVRLFDRAAGLVARLPPDQVERGMRLLDRIPDDLALRLVALLAAVPDDDVGPLLQALGRLEPSMAARAAGLVARLLRRVG